MSHDHHERDCSGNLKVAFFLNLAFTVVEIIGGLWTNSIAVLTDALHDAGDCASLGSAWFFERLSKRGPTPRHTYGYRRHRLLGALITGVMLVVGLGFVLWHSVARLRSPEAVNAPGMIALAVVGILFNGAAVMRVRKGVSLTERMVSWHLLEDVLGWCVVLIGAAIMTIWNAPIVDPILSLLVSVFVIVNVGRNLKKVIAVFLQTTPHSFDMEQFRRKVSALPKVRSIHHTHSWSLDGEQHVLTTHLVMEPDATRNEIVEAKRSVAKFIDRSTFIHVTVDIELAGEPCATTEHKSSPPKENNTDD